MPDDSQTHGVYKALVRMLRHKDPLQFSDDDLVIALQNLHADMLPDHSLRDVYVRYMGGDATWGANNVPLC